MGRRKAVSLEEKLALVEEYLAGRLRLREAARRAGVGHSTMESWISRYRSEGASALAENGNQCKRRYETPGGGGVPVRPGQLHGHCGKVSASFRESGIGLGKGVS